MTFTERSQKHSPRPFVIGRGVPGRCVDDCHFVFGVGVGLGVGVTVGVGVGVAMGVGLGVGDGSPPVVVRRMVPPSPTVIPVNASLANEMSCRFAELPLV